MTGIAELSTTNSSQPGWRNSRWLRIGGSAAVLAALLLLLPARAVLEGLRAVPAGVWPLAVVAYLSCHMIGVAKWRLLVNTAGAQLPLGVSAPALHAAADGSRACMVIASSYVSHALQGVG